MNCFGFAVLAAVLGVVATMHLPDRYDHYNHRLAPYKAVEYTFPVRMPEVQCGHNLLIGCKKPDGEGIPCNEHSFASEPVGHHYEVPWDHREVPMMYQGDPGAHYEDHHEPIVALPRHKMHRKHKHRHHRRH